MVYRIRRLPDWTACRTGRYRGYRRTPQSATITTAFATALQVTVTDANGNPLGGQTVTFAIPTTGASAVLSSPTAVTDATGLASVTATANSAAGSYNVTATIGNLAPATFALTNTPGPPAAVTEFGGTKQSTTIQTAFIQPLRLLVTDAGNNPVPGVTVAFAAPASGASAVLSSAAPVTDATGIASVTATANSIVGNYSVTATVAGFAPDSYLLANTVGAPTAVTATGGTPQSAAINSGFGAALQATVTDAGGNPVSGVTVTFAVPASGASAVLSSNTAVTNSAGVATVTAGSNAKVGAYSVTATVANVGAPASFSLTNTVGAPAAVTAIGGTPQSAAIGAAFGAALQVTVVDAGGNPVSGATVSFAAPGSGASATLSSSSAVTNAGGAASVTANANLTVGAYAVTASVAGVAAPASFSLTNTAGPPAGLTVVSGTPQSAVINSGFGAALQAKVTDAGGNPVSGATVTFTATPSASGASATLSAGTAVTNASGVASVTAGSNSKVGSYNVNATVGGVATAATFVLTNTVGAPAAITITSGTPQSAGINTAFGGALQVTVSDAGSNPVSGVTVFFAAPSSGASAVLSAPSAVTNAAGIASVTAKANVTAGTYNVNAAISNLSTVLNFALTNTAGVPATLTVAGGTPQSATIKAAFGAPLQVIVTDAGNNPLAGVIVVFTAPATGASAVLSGATATTNAAGVASVTATANPTAGSYMVTASVSDVQNPVSFALTNNAGSPALLTAVGGTPQTALLSTAFGAALQVQVTDAGSNPLSGVTVAFIAPKGGATAALSSSTAVTNASGIASVTATANATVGTYSVTAAIYQVTSTASFVLTNSVTAPLSITTTALPSGITSIHYETTLAAANGTAPLSWSLPAGTLPGGLSLSTSGIISGTPSAAGSFPFTAKVTDATGQTAQAALTIIISAAPTITNLPATQQPNTAISGVQITVPAATASPITGTITLAFAASVAGLPAGYADPAMAFVGGGTTYNFTIAAGTASVTVPDINPGTVAGTIVASIVESGVTVATANVVVPDVAPVIKASSVQITNVTATGFDVEVVATSSTPCNISTATFTFNAATGAQITGTTFTVDVSAQIGAWYGTVANLQSFGSAFTLTVPFTLSGSIAAIQSVDVTLTNSAGTSRGCQRYT